MLIPMHTILNIVFFSQENHVERVYYTASMYANALDCSANLNDLVK